MTQERRFTDSLATFFAAPPDALVAIGDDAAVLATRGRETVVCVDPVVEGVHFSPATPPSKVGYKAVARNLSDLAAMGAIADYLVASVLLPEGYPARRRKALFEGMRRCASAADCAVVGGDVATSPGPLTVTVTALGHLETAPLRRAGAKAGAHIHVTGPLGGSIRGHHLNFVPRLAEGRWLAGRPEVEAAIDISDGCVLDLATMLRASGGLGAILDAEALPIRAAARAEARARSCDPVDCALIDGEDYELLFCKDASRKLGRGGPLSTAARVPIGVVTSTPGLFLRQPSGALVELDPEQGGYSHEL